MKNALYLGLGLITVLSASLRADQNLAGNVTITGGSSAGNLNVTGTIDSDGNSVSFGTQSTGTPTVPGAIFTYTDNSLPTGGADTFKALVNRSLASWVWTNGPNGGPFVNAMRLDNAHQLLLFRSDGTTAGLTLTPQTGVIKFGTNASATLTPNDTTGAITLGGPVNITGVFTASAGITNTNGSFTGGSSGLNLSAGGTNQNITLTPAGSGTVQVRNSGTPSILSTLATDNGGTFILNGWTNVALQTGSITRLFAQGSTGNVGVGTTTPSRLFSINGPSNAYLGFKVADTLQSTIGSDGNADFLVFDDQTSTYRLVVNSNGNVGIGTTSPRTNLQVVGPITAGSAAGSTSGVDYLYGNYGNGKLFVAGSQYSSGASFFGYAVKAQNGAVGYLSSTDIPVGRSSIEASNGYLAFFTGSTQTSTDGGVVSISERVRVDSAGNVGVGTSTPGSRRLNVFTSDAANDVGAEINIVRTSGTNYGLIASAIGAGAGMNQGILATASGGSVNYGLRIFNVAASAGNYALYSDSAAQSYFQGNVGVGTITPGAQLHVVGNGPALGAGVNTQNFLASGSSGFIGYSLRRSDDANSGWMMGTCAALVGDFGIYQNQGASLAPVSRLLISPSGNVGIGTTNPGSYKLAVVGSIHATSVVVETGWSDYVFDNDYRLAPLSEVEAHIKAEKHLPGIPSAAEVAEKGVSLGDMQSKLLAKVEELTLHLIEQEKRIQKLERENASLRSNHLGPQNAE